MFDALIVPGFFSFAASATVLIASYARKTYLLLIENNEHCRVWRTVAIVYSLLHAQTE